MTTNSGIYMRVFDPLESLKRSSSSLLFIFLDLIFFALLSTFTLLTLWEDESTMVSGAGRFGISESLEVHSGLFEAKYLLVLVEESVELEEEWMRFNFFAAKISSISEVDMLNCRLLFSYVWGCSVIRLEGCRTWCVFSKC